ncbi:MULTISPECIES: hypothetical protein [unclassified Nocardia]|uniref:hypothetical protein n=1 Tax=unclassified Nocardia TaxID=2637762 RepID=UPI003433D2B2
MANGARRAGPAEPFTPADAHLTMQLHRDHDCERKHPAFDALAAAVWNRRRFHTATTTLESTLMNQRG